MEKLGFKVKKKISIILPNFNSEKYIKETIRSILNQSFKAWELIIVDDCSNIETKNILANYKKNKKIKIFYLKTNKGAAYCRNFAIKKAQSEYLAFIDSDDVWKKNKLRKQILYMSSKKLDFSFTNYYAYFEKNSKLKKIKCPETMNFQKFTKNTSIGTSTMMVKKKLVKNINFSKTKICEDYFYKCLILKKVKTAYCLNDFLTIYKVREQSLQSNSFRNLYWVWKINKKFNKLKLLRNLISVISISLNSIKKYGFK